MREFSTSRSWRRSSARRDLELELRLGDALLDLRLLLGQQLQLVLPLFAAALILGLRGREIRLGLVLGHHLLDAGRERRGDVAEHLAAELQGDERRAEPARGAGLELRDRVHHLRRRGRCLRRSPDITCAADSDFCCSCLLRVHQLLELRVQVLDLHLDVLALAATARASASSTCRTCFFRMSRTASSSAVSFDARSDASAFGVASLEHAQRHRAEAADLLGQPHRAVEQEPEPVVRRRRVEARDHAAEIDAGGRRAHEQPGIDRRLEQRRAAGRCPGCSCSCGS